MPLHSPRTFILLALLGCTFDATGLGADGTGGATGTSATSTSTSDSSTGGPSSSLTGETPSGSGSASDSATSDATTTTTTGVATDTSGDPPASCGDAMIAGDEACDDGNNNGPTKPCTSACTVNVCGDGYPLADIEACDDGNNDDGDGCTNKCTLPPGCGNGKLDNGEQCDDGNMVDTDACIACKKAVCGDGYVEANVESCDGGIETAECNADCSIAMCGDLKFNPSAGEVCDLGGKNGVYDSGCAADCKGVGAFCGDNKVDAPDEKCDPGVPPPSSTCAANCQTISCTGGHANCDKMIANGCEINTESDKYNCGECGNKCGIIQKCQEGECVL